VTLIIRSPNKLASEWHPTKNGDLRLEEFRPFSNKKVWWKCPKAEDHEWESTIANRSAGKGCPFCSGQKVGKDNNLLILNPKLAAEWHPSKNGDKKPENFTLGNSNKVWWKCPKADDHEWQTSVDNRSNKGSGCPFCSGRRADNSNNLLVLHPELANEWHPTKNKDLKPENLKLSSHKKIWWKCPKADDHEWQTSAYKRTNRKQGCPFCSGRKADILNNLLVLHPEIAREWHPTKNRDLKPEKFRAGSGKKVWWKCFRFKDHEWEANIASRVKGSGCPSCAGKGTSQPEIRILCELKYLIGSGDVEWRSRIEKVEIDIFLPQLNIGIEYDGYHWHKNKLEADLEKNIFFQKKGIQILRIREYPLKKISKNDLINKNNNLTKDNLNDLVLKIKEKLKPSSKINFDKYLLEPIFLNEAEFKRYLSFLPSPPPEYSLMNMHPKISKQWHIEKNMPLTPENFSPGSPKKVWWKCPEGDDHEWESSINARTNVGRGCPFCVGQKASNDNNLLALYPELAREWHPTKNNDLMPEGFTPGSGKRIWWKCPKSDNHEWESKIYHRVNGSGCPVCYGVKADKSNNIVATNPEIAKEWHPTKNGDLKPENFKARSGKKVWWKCPKADDHEWEQIIRYKGKCKFCSGKKASSTCNLLLLNPKLAKEWHPSKNNDLKPEQLVPSSSKKVWWQCAKGQDHNWEASIRDRAIRGHRCPFCSGRKKIR
jgi:very-short-patch-repair endonuclease